VPPPAPTPAGGMGEIIQQLRTLNRLPTQSLAAIRSTKMEAGAGGQETRGGRRRRRECPQENFSLAISTFPQTQPLEKGEKRFFLTKGTLRELSGRRRRRQLPTTSLGMKSSLQGRCPPSASRPAAYGTKPAAATALFRKGGVETRTAPATIVSPPPSERSPKCSSANSHPAERKKREGGKGRTPPRSRSIRPLRGTSPPSSQR
jgi:hypothetical protein